MDNVKKLQDEVKALIRYREEAAELIRKMNESTDTVQLSIDEEILKIKKKIENDVQELKKYISSEIYATNRISLTPYVEKDQNGRPLAYFSIDFEQRTKPINKLYGEPVHYDVVIYESCHSGRAVYADGHWADEFSDVLDSKISFGNNRNSHQIVEILCRNWDSMIEGAYIELSKAYRKITEEGIRTAVNIEQETMMRYEALSSITKKEPI